MTPPAAVIGVVVAHGHLAEALVRAVEGISGVEGALVPISNAGCTPETLRRRVAEAIAGRPSVVFVDMASGSCAFAGRRVAGEEAESAVVTGVNLPMLLDFVFHRDLSPRALAVRVAGKGRTAAEVHPPEGADADVDRADSH